jgi:hypothetical protein
MGALVYHKAVRLRQGDQDVFFRAAWSIRQGGADLYEFTDEHGWHYHYPPLFAILMAPLASPPATVSVDQQHAILPRVISVLVLYLINITCLVLGLRLIATCLGSTSDDPRRRFRLFVLPIAICLPTIGLTMIRGQVDLLMIMLIACFAAALAAQKPFTAGLALAAAICIKIIPAFLVILPLWRRDRRCLLGCAVGAFVGLALVPALVLGPGRTIELYARQAEVVLGPALGAGADASRGAELLDARATVNQSFQMVLHLTLYYGQLQIPPRPAAWVRSTHWLLVALLTAMVLWGHGRPAEWDCRRILIVTALLSVLMVVASPVCHLHYFTLVLPLAMVVVDYLLDRGITWGWAMVCLVPISEVAFMLPRLVSLRDLGLPMYATMGLWLTGWWLLRDGREHKPDAQAREHKPDAQARERHSLACASGL